MAELALILWGVYFVLALGLRVLLHSRRTGRTGLLLMRSHPGSAGWLGETLELLGLGLGVAAPVFALGASVEPLAFLDTTALHVCGIVLYTLGLAGIVVSQQIMGRSWRIGVDPDERTELVTRGPFGKLRNPIFSSLVALQSGLTLLVPSPVALAGLVLLVASVEIQARLVEEPHLLRVHGEPYAAYARRTGRFLPGLGRLR